MCDIWDHISTSIINSNKVLELKKKNTSHISYMCICKLLLIAYSLSYITMLSYDNPLKQKNKKSSHIFIVRLTPKIDGISSSCLNSNELLKLRKKHLMYSLYVCVNYCQFLGSLSITYSSSSIKLFNWLLVFLNY